METPTNNSSAKDSLFTTSLGTPLMGYQWAWKAFEPALTGHSWVTKAELLQRIEELRERGLGSVSINTFRPTTLTERTSPDALLASSWIPVFASVRQCRS